MLDSILSSNILFCSLFFINNLKLRSKELGFAVVLFTSIYQFVKIFLNGIKAVGLASIIIKEYSSFVQ